MGQGFSAGTLGQHKPHPACTSESVSPKSRDAQPLSHSPSPRTDPRVLEGLRGETEGRIRGGGREYEYMCEPVGEGRAGLAIPTCQLPVFAY